MRAQSTEQLSDVMRICLSNNQSVVVQEQLADKGFLYAVDLGAIGTELQILSNRSITFARQSYSTKSTKHIVIDKAVDALRQAASGFLWENCPHTRTCLIEETHENRWTFY